MVHMSLIVWPRPLIFGTFYTYDIKRIFMILDLASLSAIWSYPQHIFHTSSFSISASPPICVDFIYGYFIHHITWIEPSTHFLSSFKISRHLVCYHSDSGVHQIASSGSADSVSVVVFSISQNCRNPVSISAPFISPRCGCGGKQTLCRDCEISFLCKHLQLQPIWL